MDRRGVKAYRPKKSRARASMAARRKLFHTAARSNRAGTYRARGRNLVTAGYLGIENKFYDTAYASSTIATNTDCTGAEADPSATSKISTPVRGDGEQERDGKKIVITSCQIVGSVYRPSVELDANPALPALVYVALVLDTQTNAATLNSEDVFKNTGAESLMNADPIRNLLFGPRFKVLKTFKCNLSDPAVTHFAVDSFATNALQVPFAWYLPKLNLPVNFNAGTTASIANVIDNSLHVVCFSTITGLKLQYQARIRFQG